MWFFQAPPADPTRPRNGTLVHGMCHGTARIKECEKHLIQPKNILFHPQAVSTAFIVSVIRIARLICVQQQ